MGLGRLRRGTGYTDLTARLDTDKVPAATVADSALDALEAGASEAVVDELSANIKAGLPNDQHLLYPAIRAQFDAAQSAAAHWGLWHHQ